MITPDIPVLETERIRSVRDCLLLDTPPEKEYDDITKLASQICGTPFSLITIIDSNRQWFKSHKGLDMVETPRSISFCAHAINNPHEIMQVYDTRKDKRFFDHPFVVNQPNIAFYFGIPLLSADGHAIGTLCVADNKPRILTESQIDSLKALANQVIKLIELRKANNDLINSNEEKTVLLKEINHRVKNNLSIIIALIRAEQDRCTSDQCRNIFEELLSKLFSISSLQNQLYISNNYKDINFGIYLKNMISGIDHSFGNNYNTNIDMKIEEEIFDITVAVPFGLIANEILVNSYKHAFNENRTNNLSISFSRNKKNQIVLQVKDNGNTITGINKTKGNGIELIEDLVYQIDATATFLSNKNGSIVTITL